MKNAEFRLTKEMDIQSGRDKGITKVELVPIQRSSSPIEFKVNFDDDGCWKNYNIRNFSNNSNKNS